MPSGEVSGTLSLPPTRPEQPDPRSGDGANPRIGAVRWGVRVVPTHRAAGKARASGAALSLAVLAVLCAAGGGQDTAASFPGPVELLAAPDGARAVRWVPPATSGGDHLLLLVEAHDPAETTLLRFPRHVRALWSPSGRHLAVTNTYASDEGTVLLWEDLPGEPRDLLEELARHEGEGRARWGAHHVYLESVGWLSDRELSLRLWGYGDPDVPSINRRYTLVLGKGFSRE
jgi:hypothetical protein